MKLTARLWRSAATLYTRIEASPVVFAACTFTALYLFAYYHFRSISSRDPGSWFFDPSTAYDLRYTAVRQQEAETYVLAASTAPPFKSRSEPGASVPLCVGVPSIARNGARYLRTTIGSLLQGLTQEERDGIHLVVFIPHTDPEVHPAYHEAWLANLADDVLLYNLTQSQLDHIAFEQARGNFTEKALFDYTYLLKACRETRASYIAILEDDVIAMDGWFHRTLAGLKQAEQKSASRHGSGDFLYLRLFYTEHYLGWNSEDWPTHAFWSICFIIACALTLYGVRSRFPNSEHHLNRYVAFAILGLPVPLVILLFFAAGKVTTLPIPAGVNEMNKFGCCAQGLVFPQHKALELIEWFETTKFGYADALTEKYADKHGEHRWALTPSVIQHIGLKSSKGADYGKATKLWNFAFESYDATKLREEHALAAQGYAR